MENYQQKKDKIQKVDKISMAVPLNSYHIDIISSTPKKEKIITFYHTMSDKSS